MLPLLLLLVLPSAYPQNVSYVFDGVPYARQTILTTDDNYAPVFLSINPKTDQLYFNLVKVNTMEFQTLHTLKDGKLFQLNSTSTTYKVAAIDVAKDVVYIGTTDGVRILDGERAGLVGLANESIFYLFKPLEDNKLFAITFPSGTVYELDTSTFKETRMDLISPANRIITDREGNIFYAGIDGFHVLLKDLKEPRFVDIPKETFVALAVDHKNRVIVTAADGLYWVKANSRNPVKFMNLDFNPSGIVFKNDEIYISRMGAIYKFTH